MGIKDIKRIKLLNQHGYSSLALIDKILSDNSLPYWLYAGTLLGMIRDKGFIHSDNDMDIGVWYSKDAAIQIEKILIDYDFRLLWEYVVDGKVLEQRYEHRGVGIDFYYFRKNKTYCHASSCNKNDKGQLYLVEERYKSSTFDKLKRMSVRGIDFNVPKDYVYVLESMYGNWQVPVTKEDGFVMFQNPNMHHRYDVRAEAKHHNKSSIKKSPLDIIKYLLRLNMLS